MKRFFKTCGSLVMAASLVLGIAAVPSKAADSKTMTLEEFNSLYATVKTATSAVAASTPTRTDVNVDLDIPLLGKSTSTITEILDPTHHTTKTTTTSNGVSTDSYGDLAKGCRYSYSTAHSRYEVSTNPANTSTTSLLDSLDINKIADSITVTVGEGKKINDVACQATSINLKLEGEKLATVINDIYNMLGTSLSGLASNSSLGSIDLKSALKAVDLTITLYVDDAFILRSTEINGTVTVDFAGSSLNIPLTMSSVSGVVNEVVVIPADIVKSAQLVTGFVVSKGGVKFKSALSGKNTVFSVTTITKKSAKKLTIPGTISQFGKSYKVTTAAKNVFKAAKKLKTLVIKNATLKKAVKKNRSKYGLSKKVKIK